MWKPVKSTDPRKKFIMSALKNKTGANKITSVYQIAESEFQGDCLKGNRSGYEKLGTFAVTITTCERCSADKDNVVSRPCPYSQDIYNDSSLHFLCDACCGEAADDI